jgi:hypothetical protein
VLILVYFSHFVMLYQEKSDNPAGRPFFIEIKVQLDFNSRFLE